jgi:dipeptidyl aminopeptidase/acylaminoacyl peptidase
MPDQKKLPYGQWPSQISPQRTGGMLDLSEPCWNSSGQLFWRERNAKQASIHMTADGRDSTPISGEMNVGGGLFYGGGSYGVDHEWAVLVDSNTQQLIRVSLGDGSVNPLTTRLKYSGSPMISPNGQTILFVHSDGEQDKLLLTSTEKGPEPHPCITGADFYNYPRWHPSGDQIAWISWNHPHMPWDTSALWLGSVEISRNGNLELSSKSLIAGGEGISIIQPEFSPNGKWLAYISDQSGWWQIHLYELATGDKRQLTETPADHALPPWLQNRNSFGFSPDSERIYFLRNQEGFGSLWSWNLESDDESCISLDQAYTWLDWFSISPSLDKIAIIASASDQPPQLITVDPTGQTSIIRKSTKEDLPTALFSIPKPITWPTSGNTQIKGLYYPPHNPDYTAEGKPPLLVMVHSGPTSQKFRDFSTRTQFFTSRGFAVLEVNYRGSTGYGRAYRQALKGKWGVVDVDDCLTGARYIAEQGWVDQDKMAVMGSSSGGLTVYQILVKYPGSFQAGIVLYGIVNHLDLLKDPPKFERHYSEWLIGPYPEEEELYRERSPIFFADQIQDPIAIFQGGMDPIVPQNQADQIIKALGENQVPYLYRLYPMEGHGFKGSETIEDFYQQSVDFLKKFVLGEIGEENAHT